LIGTALDLAVHHRGTQANNADDEVPSATSPSAWVTAAVTEPARGGHFAPFQEPELYAEELRATVLPRTTGERAFGAIERRGRCGPSTRCGTPGSVMQAWL
jgi:hypothetical protein